MRAENGDRFPYSPEAVQGKGDENHHFGCSWSLKLLTLTLRTITEGEKQESSALGTYPQ